MTVNSLQYHSYLEESCKIVNPDQGYTLNRENNEIIVTFRQALGCLVEIIDFLREPISNLNKDQERYMRIAKRMFAFTICKAKIQDLRQDNQHLNKQELKELKANLATEVCNEFDIKKENKSTCLNDREFLAEDAVQFIALDKKSGRLFLLKNCQPIPAHAGLFTINVLSNLTPQTWRINRVFLRDRCFLSYQDNPNNPFRTLVSNGKKFSFAYYRGDYPKINPFVTVLWETFIKGEIPLCYTRFGVSKENFFGRKQLHIL